jgi:DNA processing protein
VAERGNINLDEEWESLERENIKITAITDENYPQLLKEIPNAPYIIYSKGKAAINDAFLISIVGSRKYTSYGSQVALNFSRELAEAGITVVSGMALGIDSFAHRGALDDDIYPRNNFNLSREIIGSGMLLSEYPPGTPAGPLTFPARNRIIAGMSLGTIVVEAGEKSGALLTAQMALDYNREVFSIPGSIFSSQSVGTNNLIKKGARVVTGVKDILDELDLNFSRGNKEKTVRQPGTMEEKILLETLTSDPLHIDNISKLTKLKTSEVSSALAMMEIKGWVKNIGGQNYIIL